jgi:hypothetical protein
MGVACSTHCRGENCIQNFGRKPEGKRPFGRSKSRCEIILESILRK